MKWWKESWVALFVLLGVVLLALTFFPHSFGMGKRRLQLARRTQINADKAHYAAAVAAYSNQFGVLPLGDNRSITPLLFGSNSQGLIFFSLPAHSKRLSEQGEFLDPDGIPYAIEITTNAMRIVQRPK